MARELAAVLIALGPSFAGSVLAQTEEARDAPRQQPPRIEVSLVDADETVTVWGHLRVSIAFVAQANDVGVQVSDICVSLPQRLGMGVRRHDEELDPCKIIPDPIELRRAGARSITEVEFERRAPEPSLLSLLPYRERTELLTVRASYASLDDPDKLRSEPLESQLAVKVAAHPLGVFAGALLGSLLAAALAVSARVSLNPSFSPAAVALLPFAAVGRCVRGAIAATIVILLMKTTAELSLPVSIDVRDFYGGVLLGLFGDAIARAIWRRIEAAERDSAAASAAAPSPPTPLAAAD